MSGSDSVSTTSTTQTAIDQRLAASDQAVAQGAYGDGSSVVENRTTVNNISTTTADPGVAKAGLTAGVSMTKTTLDTVRALQASTNSVVKDALDRVATMAGETSKASINTIGDVVARQMNLTGEMSAANSSLLDRALSQDAFLMEGVTDLAQSQASGGQSDVTKTVLYLAMGLLAVFALMMFRK